MAQASQCPSDAWGGQTGDHYTLVGQASVTITGEAAYDAGFVSIKGTVSYTYNQGTYTNSDTGQTVQVNCSTGQVIPSLSLG